MTFGGGYSCLPIMEKELVEKRKMISSQELLDSYAVAQMMPGLIAVNVGVLIGYKKSKFLGALAILLGTITPPLIIGIFVAITLDKYLKLEMVNNIFWGVRVAVCVLIFTVIYKLIKQMDKSLKNVVIVVLSFCLYYFFNLSPIFIIILTILFAIIIVDK